MSVAGVLPIIPLITPFYADDSLLIYAGDARTVLADLMPGSIQSVITSPPYWGLRDYGVEGQLGLEPTPEAQPADAARRAVGGAPMPRPTVVPQLGFDEQVIEDAEVEQALEEREKRKASLSAVRKVYDGAHEAAVAEIAKLELPEGGAARVGRFRIARTAIPARSVTFDTKASSRVRISVIDAD